VKRSGTTHTHREACSPLPALLLLLCIHGQEAWR